MRKKITLAMMLLLCIISAMAQEQGTTGALQWKYDSDSHTLTITGEGDMPDYDYGGTPWNAYQEEIQTLSIGDGVTSVGDNAFCNCVALSEFNLPEGVTRIGNNAFSYCLSFTSVELPSTVRKIDESAFEGCNIESINFPEGLEGIGGFAFADCIYLGNVQFPATLGYIDRWAFSGCEGLSEVSIPAGVKSIGDNAFANCINLFTLQLSEGLETIDENAFAGCEQLTQATIPASVTTIGGGIFADCTNMDEIQVAPGSASFSAVDGVLYDKAQTTLVQYPTGKADESYFLPDGVTAIGDYAFCGNESLSRITLHDKLQSIGNYAFARVSAASEFSVPASVELIGESAFHDCWSLTAIHVEEANPNYKSLDGVLYDKALTTLMQYPEGKTTADYVAPETLQNVSSYAFFNNTHLATVDLPSAVQFVGDFAFGFCSQLSQLTVRVADPQDIVLGLMPFFRGGGAVDCTLRVPAGSKEKYEQAEAWSDFAPHIEELTADSIAPVANPSVLRQQRVYNAVGVLQRGTIGQQHRGLYIVDGKKVLKR